ncbi:MAG: MmcQ/YjbR family DNA-binding protein [Dehalococcoidia bacterium]
MRRSFSADIREFALAFEGSREEFSFGSDHPVFKAPNGKMFAIASEDSGGTNVSLKLTPDECSEALTLPFVRPAPYLARYHWIMSTISNEAECEMTLSWIRRSFELVTTKPTRKR